MTPWMVGERGVCAALMAACAVVLALRPSARVARTLWIALWAAGLVNALALNLQEANLLGSNLVHYYVGAKYPVPYADFYRVVQAGLGKPQAGFRDLDRPAMLLNADPTSKRAYFIDLLRGAGVSFDPRASLEQLEETARASGALARESERILEQHLPPERIEEFRRDVRAAASVPRIRAITEDYGFNGSPFYALLRRADPTLYAPLGRAAAWLNMVWQILAVALLAWVASSALGLDSNRRLAIGALIFASWDFVAFALPGLLFGELWLPVAVAALAMRNRRAAAAGIGVAWAGLIKLFPFILLLPPLARAVATGVREGGRVWRARASSWSLRLVAACAAAVVVLGFAALLGGHSWLDFSRKILAEFHADFSLVNSVSRSAALQTFGVHRSFLNPVLSLVALAFLLAMFIGDRDESFLANLPRRSLVLLSATGWVVHTWLNYYALVPCLLLPFYAREHRAGATAAAFGMAAAFLLPDFDDPLLLAEPALHALKLLPYLLIPAWMVALELRGRPWGIGVRRAAMVAVAAAALGAAGETWRMRTIQRLDATGRERLRVADPAGALESYTGMTRLAPRDGRARMYKAIALATLGRVGEARADFERAAALAPDYAPAQDNYGRMLLMEGRVEEAATYLEKAQALAPHNIEIKVVLARARMAQGRTEEAAALLGRALELDPGNSSVAELLRQVQGS